MRSQKTVHYCIYHDHPNYRHHWVVVKWELEKAEIRIATMEVFPSLEAARKSIPSQYVCLPPRPDDHLSIFEVWI